MFTKKLLVRSLLVLVVLAISATAAFAAGPSEYPIASGPNSGAKRVETTAGMWFKVDGLAPATAKVTLTVYAGYGVTIADADGKNKLSTTNNTAGLDTGKWTLDPADLGKTFQITSKPPYEKQVVRLVFNTDAEAKYTVYVADVFPEKLPPVVSPLNWTELEISSTGTAIPLNHGDTVRFRSLPSSGARLQVVSIGTIALVNRTAGDAGKGDTYVFEDDIATGTDYKLEVLGGKFQAFVLGKGLGKVEYVIIPAKK